LTFAFHPPLNAVFDSLEFPPLHSSKSCEIRPRKGASSQKGRFSEDERPFSFHAPLSLFFLPCNVALHFVRHTTFQLHINNEPFPYLQTTFSIKSKFESGPEKIIHSEVLVELVAELVEALY
jgi:hypothetical protein